MGWTDFGFDNDHWTEHIVTGVTASISEGVTAGTRYDLLGKFASETLSTFAYNALDGKGFSDEYGDMHGTFNWQSFAPKAEYIGTYFGRMAGDYLSEKISEKLDGMAKKAADREAGKLPSGADDPFAGIEDMLGAAWQGLKKIKESLHEIEKGIAQGFNGLTGEIFSGVNEALVGLGSNIGHEIMDFGESVKNGIAYGEFNTDDSIEVRHAKLTNQMAEAGVNLRGMDPFETIGQRVVGNDGTVYKVTPSGMVAIGKMAAFGDREGGVLVGSQQGEAAAISGEIAETWKTSSAKEVNALLNQLKKIDPEAAKQWNRYFKGVRDSEARQNDINASLRQAELGTHSDVVKMYDERTKIKFNLDLITNGGDEGIISLPSGSLGVEYQLNKLKHFNFEINTDRFSDSSIEVQESLFMVAIDKSKLKGGALGISGSAGISVGSFKTFQDAINAYLGKGSEMNISLACGLSYGESNLNDYGRRWYNFSASIGAGASYNFGKTNTELYKPSTLYYGPKIKYGR